MRSSIGGFVTAATVFTLLAGCDVMDGIVGIGSIELSVVGASLLARSIGPDIDLGIDHYAVHGESDAGAIFDRSTSESQIVVSGLAAGYWTVTVNAQNAAGVTLYTASDRLLVRRGSSLPVLFSLAPVQGDGTLSVGVTWPDDEVLDPALDSSLVPLSGATIPLVFVVAGDAGSVTKDDVASGYHTLIVKLRDGAQIVAGAVELVQVVQGETTSADLEFADVNEPGALDMDIAPQFSESLVVSIAGGERETGYGVPATLTGSVEGDAGNTVFTWYVNGSAVDSGVSETTISAQVPGHYRVDLIAVTADGLEGGSATSWIDVAEPAL